MTSDAVGVGEDQKVGSSQEEKSKSHIIMGKTIQSLTGISNNPSH